MDLFLNALKGQVNSLNLVVFIFALAAGAFFINKRRLAKLALVMGVLVFLIAATGYTPRWLVGRIESAFSPFQPSAITDDSSKVVIHVLGGGYVFDDRLPALSQLSAISLGRLTEGVKIANQIPGSTLVFSGWRVSGSESMASVMKQAAISLGIDAARIVILESPRTTEEEADSFVSRFGKDVRPIVVTDAIHMRRALSYFEELGIEAHPAPTNYLVRNTDDDYRFRWMPAAENFLLMDRMLREWLGSLKSLLS